MNHGTAYCYRKYGCRCDPCREAKRRASRQAHANRRAREATGLPSPGLRAGRPKIPLSERPHGSWVTYCKGCRCRPCTVANSEYGRLLKQFRRKRSEPEEITELRRLAESLGYQIHKRPATNAN
jgi:hypothetical protein